MQKQGTPTMGGIIILSAILIPTLLLADLTNVYIQCMLLVTVLLGGIGFIDDYIKVFMKNKEGLAGKFKVVGQVAASLLVAAMLFWNPQVRVKELVPVDHGSHRPTGGGPRWRWVGARRAPLPEDHHPLRQGQ